MKRPNASVICRSFVIAASALLVPAAAAAQNSMTVGSLKPLATLTSSDGFSGAVFGATVAVSGNVVAVGAPEQIGGNGCFNGGGSIYVYEKPANGWESMVQTAELTSDVSCMMNLVAFSGDTIVATELGCTGDGFYLPGSVFVFVKPEGGWTNMGPTAVLSPNVGTGCNGDGSFAITAAINQSQDLIVAGQGPKDTALVFRRPAGGWVNTSKQNETIQAPAGSGNFGSVVALDGNVLAVGASQNGLSGSVYVYNVSAKGAQLLATLTPSNSEDNPDMGVGVAIAGDTIAAGAPLVNSDQGVIYVFQKPAGGWSNMTETAQLSVAGIPSDFAILGEKLALNPAGNEIVSGYLSSGPPDPLGYVFSKPASGWQTTSTPSVALFADGTGEPGNFDSAVAVSATNIVLGAGGTNFETGAAFVFGH